MATRVIVMGATGFVGSALYFTLDHLSDFEVTGVCRSARQSLQLKNLIEVGDFEEANFAPVLENSDVVIHVAARAHVTDEDKLRSIEEFRRVNVDATLRVATQAVEAGVRRFVFISSIGVNGGSTKDGAFTETDLPRPHTPYALSKLEAEVKLRKLCQKSGMELVIIRPPLIYAAHAPGNFGKLLKLVNSQMPLPFALVKNKRHFVALENIVDFTILCATHPQAANETFLVADNEGLSTPELCRLVGTGMERVPFLVPVPVVLMKLAVKLIGKQALFEQLCGSLLIDNSKAKNLLGWKPPVAAYRALTKTAQQYLLLHNKKKLVKYV